MKTKIKILLLLMGQYLYGYSQTGQIIGKINLLDIENKNAIAKNTFAILISKTINDSAKVESDLSFKFENLPSDTFFILFSCSSYPYSVKYIVTVKDGETKHLNASFSSTCPYGKSKNSICPICKKKDEVIPILYGLLATRIEKGKKTSKRKYISGGCIIMDCQPSWFCERDQKEF